MDLVKCPYCRHVITPYSKDLEVRQCSKCKRYAPAVAVAPNFVADPIEDCRFCGHEWVRRYNNQSGVSLCPNCNRRHAARPASESMRLALMWI